MMLKLAWKHIKSRPISGLITIVAATLVLTLLGSFWALKDNLSSTQGIEGEKTSNFHVFMKDGTLNSEIKRMVSLIQSSKIVESVRVVSSEEAYKEFEKQFGETLSKAVTESTLPATISATLKAGNIKRKDMVALVNQLRSQASVLEVDAGQAFSAREIETGKENRIINWAMVLFGLVFTIVALLISHIIRLAFEGNREDVETLKVLGATKMWIFTPMLLEALFYGLVSAFLTVVTLNLSIEFLLPTFANFLLPKNYDFFTLSLTSWIGVVGVAIGASFVGALMTWPLVKKAPGRA